MLQGKQQGFSLPTGFCDVDLDRVKSEPEEEFVERCTFLQTTQKHYYRIIVYPWNVRAI